MLKYEVRYACGCKGEIKIYGIQKPLERIKRMEGSECQACRERNCARKALADAESNNYPMLTGTFKQAVLATTIRYTVICKIRSAFESAFKDSSYKFADEDRTREWMEMCIRNMAASETGARFWIDHLNYYVESFFPAAELLEKYDR